MYINIKDNTLIEWANWEFEGSSYIEIDYDYFCENQDKFNVIDGNLCDISTTNEYLEKKSQEESTERQAQLKIEIEQLDIKRIRAIAEPELKDAETGETWIEYYTAQISALREELGLPQTIN